MTDLIAHALAEDLGSGDLTSLAVVPEDACAQALLVARADGVVAGIEPARAVFAAAGRDLALEALANDGDRVEPGRELVRARGSARAILAAERVALNLLGRLSGVATLTARYVGAVADTGVTILDTRKTTPGLRALEKAAVVAGGGRSHRFGLYDALLVKENHVRIAGSVAEATRRALAGAPAGMGIEIEVESVAELEQALAAGADHVLLDNFEPDQLRAAVAVGEGRVRLEASGGITLENVREVAETGVDFISIGALTHSAPALDVSLVLESLGPPG